jgi:acyl-CoA synthetase (AMP-forming)/AMP-acid ligase II
MRIEATRPLLGEYFRLHAKWRGAKPALIAGGETLTWRQFNGRMNRVANMVHGAGLKVGDRAIVFMDNGADMAEILFGLIKAGVASAPLNLSVSDAAIAEMIRDSGARAVFASWAYSVRLSKIISLRQGRMKRPNRIFWCGLITRPSERPNLTLSLMFMCSLIPF